MTTILIVEDTEDLAALIEQELRSAGFETRLAGDAPQALALLAQQPPDLIVLDWMLPRGNGLDVLRQARALPGLDIPVLMLTARREEVDRVLGLELGADDYMTKPFSLRELTARVRALLRRAERIQAMLHSDQQAAQENVVTVRYQGLELAPETYTALLDGQALDLTRLEFDLLALLARSPGRTFSRAYLFETVWGERFLEGDRSVDNTVVRLRKKLGPLGEAIETVWGIGYRLERETK